MGRKQSEAFLLSKLCPSLRCSVLSCLSYCEASDFTDAEGDNSRNDEFSEDLYHGSRTLATRFKLWLCAFVPYPYPRHNEQVILTRLLTLYSHSTRSSNTARSKNKKLCDMTGRVLRESLFAADNVGFVRSKRRVDPYYIPGTSSHSLESLPLQL